MTKALNFTCLFFISTLPLFCQGNESKTDSLITLLQETDPAGKSILYNELALSLEGNPDTALFYADSAVIFAQVFKDFKGEADASVTRGRILYNEFDGKEEDAISMIRNSIPLYKKARHREGSVQALLRIARIYGSLENTDSARYYFDSAERLAKSIKDRKGLSDVYLYRGRNARRSDEPELAILYLDQSARIKEDIGDTEGLGNIYSQLALINYMREQFDAAMENWKKALHLYEISDQKFDAGRMLVNISTTYIANNQYEEASEYLEKALNVFEEIEDQKAILSTLNNLGITYFTRELYDDAIEIQMKILAKASAISDAKFMTCSYMNLGDIYTKIAEDSLRSAFGEEFQDSVSLNPDESSSHLFDDAVNFYEQALELTVSPGDIQIQAEIYLNLGIIDLNTGKYRHAIDPIKKALDLSKELGDSGRQLMAYLLLGESYTAGGEYSTAETYLKKGLQFTDRTNTEARIRLYKQLSELYEKQDQYIRALQYHKLYHRSSDAQKNKAHQELVDDLDKRRSNEKSEDARAIERVYQLWDKEKELEKAKDRHRNIVILAGLALFLLLMMFLMFVIRAFRQRNRADKLLLERNKEFEAQKDEIEAQRDEIEAQRDEITRAKNALEEQKDVLEEQKQEVMDSILYASRIQSAILPKEEAIHHFLPKHFILYRPRDIVSGDFYWMGIRGDKLAVAAVDCTGHGVPGAFMSMLAASLLNEILSTVKQVDSAEILDELRDRVIVSLHQTGKEGEAKDGMDMSLCIFDRRKKRLQFSGANNPMYLIRNGELQEYKADRMPIGISASAGKPFTRHDITLQKGDALYMFSDGLIDQFGGSKGKKYMTARFKELLLGIEDRIMFEQKQLLEEAIESWMDPEDGPDQKYEQIDDILVIGIKI